MPVGLIVRRLGSFGRAEPCCPLVVGPGGFRHQKAETVLMGRRGRMGRAGMVGGGSTALVPDPADPWSFRTGEGEAGRSSGLSRPQVGDSWLRKIRSSCPPDLVARPFLDSRWKTFQPLFGHAGARDHDSRGFSGALVVWWSFRPRLQASWASCVSGCVSWAMKERVVGEASQKKGKEMGGREESGSGGRGKAYNVQGVAPLLAPVCH
jgi:hypothetical protein